MATAYVGFTDDALDDLTARVEPRVDPVPPWLRDRLIHTAGMEAEAVDALAGADAADLWDRYMRGGPSPSSG